MRVHNQVILNRVRVVHGGCGRSGGIRFVFPLARLTFSDLYLATCAVPLSHTQLQLDIPVSAFDDRAINRSHTKIMALKRNILYYLLHLLPIMIIIIMLCDSC